MKFHQELIWIMPQFFLFKEMITNYNFLIFPHFHLFLIYLNYIKCRTRKKCGVITRNEIIHNENDIEGRICKKEERDVFMLFVNDAGPSYCWFWRWSDFLVSYEDGLSEVTNYKFFRFFTEFSYSLQSSKFWNLILKNIYEWPQMYLADIFFNFPLFSLK